MVGIDGDESHGIPIRKKSPLRNTSKFLVGKPQPTPGDWKKNCVQKPRKNMENMWKTNKQTSKQTSVDDVGVPSTPFFFLYHRIIMVKQHTSLTSAHESSWLETRSGAAFFFVVRVISFFVRVIWKVSFGHFFLFAFFFWGPPRPRSLTKLQRYISNRRVFQPPFF